MSKPTVKNGRAGRPLSLQLWRCCRLMGIRQRALLCALLGLSLFYSPVQAEVLLTLSNAQQQIELSREQLLALPQHEVRSHTAWTDGVQQFRGPLLRDVLALLNSPLGAQSTARLIALNDYEVTVSTTDYQQWPVILAHEQNGVALTRRDKGPLWVVYPRDADTQLQDSRFDHRWAWMLRSIVLEP